VEVGVWHEESIRINCKHKSFSACEAIDCADFSFVPSMIKDRVEESSSRKEREVEGAWWY
jgi:hypothetical protein